jgi:Heme exporter protein D (CcmD)
MPQIPFIVGSYAVTIAGTLGLLIWCWLSMRRAERAAEELRRR